MLASLLLLGVIRKFVQDHTTGYVCVKARIRIDVVCFGLVCPWRSYGSPEASLVIPHTISLIPVVLSPIGHLLPPFSSPLQRACHLGSWHPPGYPLKQSVSKISLGCGLHGNCWKYPSFTPTNWQCRPLPRLPLFFALSSDQLATRVFQPLGFSLWVQHQHLNPTISRAVMPPPSLPFYKGNIISGFNNSYKMCFQDCISELLLCNKPKPTGLRNRHLLEFISLQVS